MNSAGVFLRAFPVPDNGYGRVACELARFLIRSGIRVRIQNLSRTASRNDVPEDLREYVTELDNPWPYEVLIAPPDFRVAEGKRCIYLTMWETTRLHAQWVAQLNRCDAVIVPSEFCQLVFDSCGVDTFIYKVPLGVDMGVFHSEPKQYPFVRRTDGTVRFGASGRLDRGGVRKGIDRVIEAFMLAFWEQDDVKLEVKLSAKHPPYEVDDDRVEFLCEMWSDEKLARWYQTLDCFVSGSRSECFGLLNVEAMSCGTPIIGASYAGQQEYLRDDTGLAVAYSLVPAAGVYERMGLWADLDLWHMADRMRQVANRGEDVRSLALAGMKVAQAFSWQRCCNDILAIFRERGLFETPKEGVILPSGLPANAPQEPEPLAEPELADDFAIRFGIGRAANRDVPALPAERDKIFGDGIIVIGPPSLECGVGQYARQTALAMEVPFFSYTDSVDGNASRVLIHWHRHYYEALPIGRIIHDLYKAGHDIYLDIHDPAGIEQIPGYVSGVIYHTLKFHDYIEEAVPNARLAYIPMMSPETGNDILDSAVFMRLDKKFIIGWHGLWNSHKGVDILIAAIKVLADRGQSVGLIALGAIHGIDKSAQFFSKATFDQCCELVKRYGLEHHVALDCATRNYHSINSILSFCDAYCLPYTTTVIGSTSAALAMLPLGKPIVVSNVPMFADLIGCCAKPLDEITPDCIADTFMWMFGGKDNTYQAWSDKAKACYAERMPAVVAERYLKFIDGEPGTDVDVEEKAVTA